ncbi:MAG: aminopeptidase P family protein [Planctomyces sp.]|nr:aminopeptidase P family protein [Planctomyces sp.]MBA4040137.1 aminopeptidase P family protein [Planctomyces sp.]MBA4120518.1 aminopeptidase P family protein [Isosphaera sp.]
MPISARTRPRAGTKPTPIASPTPAAPERRPLGPHAGRMARAAQAAAGLGCSHALITNPIDVGYLTGFTGGDSYLLLDAAAPASGPAAGPGAAPRALIISDFRFDEELEPTRALAEVFIRKGMMSEAVGSVLAERRVTALGVQPEHMTLAVRRWLTKKTPGLRVVEAPGLVAALRARKDAAEVALIRKAVRVAQDALEHTLGAVGAALRRGKAMTEAAIAAELEHAMRQGGSQKPSFDTIVAAGANGSLPHYRAGSVRYRAGRPLLIDWGATVGGYHSDMSRVVAFGRWPAKIAELYRVVLEAHQLAAAALAPGLTTERADAIARGHIAAAGFGERFGHGLGHGIGLDVHEDPRLSHMAPPRPLEEGMVVTIEPGIYVPGLGGVRIEDDYLITQRGAKNLCTLPKDIGWATR